MSEKSVKRARPRLVADLNSVNGAVCAKNCCELPRVQTQVSSTRLEEVLEQFSPQDLTNGVSSVLSSNDILIGEDDRDSAFAGAGRDLMIGGGTRQQ